MDMHLDDAGTYDVDLVMRDTTGTVFGADTDCQEYASQSLVGPGDGVNVTASRIGSADDDEGLGCQVRVSGVPIPDAAGLADGSAEDQLVVRDGDLYVVRIAGYGTAPADSHGAAEGADGVPDGAGGAPSPAGSLNEVVDARVSITFPGAVVDAGGGRVSGTTVTWEDADLLYDGVTASGRAVAGEGVSIWDRYGWWFVAGLVAAGAAVGAMALRRRRRSHN